jgi:hypothetical protein
VALAAVYAHRRREAPERALAKAVDAWIQAHPSWRIREYVTPAGWRLVATHRPFSTDDPEVLEFFRAIFADGTYVRMCRNQRCFRARLTPKPWRIGVTRLRGPVWPVRDPEAMERRKAWVDAYEARSASFAACRFLREAGVGLEDTEVRRVVDLHDTLSRAISGLPIA